jgi:hypothetical protein
VSLLRAAWALAAVSAIAATPAAAQQHGESPTETPIQVPPPTPTGLLIGYKPTILSVRSDTGQLTQFGSDRPQFLRFLARYTFLPLPDKPILGRVELEGGRFTTRDDTANNPPGSGLAPQLGGSGWDATMRVQVAAAARLTSGVMVIAAAGPIARFSRGSPTAGGPQIGMFGACSSFQMDIRLLPAITGSLMVEGAVAPIPFGAQENLGLLSDASEVRVRAMVSVDVTQTLSVEVGLDFTRWHAAFVNSRILGNADGALHIESRDQALILGFRWR